MAAGSERFAWARYPDAPRQCAVCGRPLRVADVGRVHSEITYRDGLGVATTTFRCTAHREATA